ncbi:hypothetical protein H257_04140 [Aphanomyces astaci]|uniref:Uncharacterized protein n=1 Tax=Aphanomyces astaci TaxID=112090 RepID=W4GUP1_APHAT|nr:hypothetical protein H257_04140 [Aphanomyces astaci]ETV83407.1 hypothetical protein H257_04140 [Aphanomyces astaci]|eukprot:XP_009826837.1 hypothetical protein H257_04140 [Aphanomyces astaci]
MANGESCKLAVPSLKRHVDFVGQRARVEGQHVRGGNTATQDVQVEDSVDVYSLKVRSVGLEARNPERAHLIEMQFRPQHVERRVEGRRPQMLKVPQRCRCALECIQVVEEVYCVWYEQRDALNRIRRKRDAMC